MAGINLLPYELLVTYTKTPLLYSLPTPVFLLWRADVQCNQKGNFNPIKISEIYFSLSKISILYFNKFNEVWFTSYIHLHLSIVALPLLIWAGNLHKNRLNYSHLFWWCMRFKKLGWYLFLHDRNNIRRERKMFEEQDRRHKLKILQWNAFNFLPFLLNLATQKQEYLRSKSS